MLCSAHSGALLPRQIRPTSSSRKSTCNGCDTGDLFARSQRPPFVLQTTARIWGHPAGDRHSSGVYSAGRGRSLSAPITDTEVALVAAPEASAASRRLAEPLAKFCGTAIPDGGMTGSALMRAPPPAWASASRNGLPADVALGYIGVVAGRLGAVIAPPRICVKSTEKSFRAEAIEPAIMIAIESAIVIAAEPAIVIAVEPAVPAMRPSIGEIWLAERGSA
jgi:hypothetical protein